MIADPNTFGSCAVIGRELDAYQRPKVLIRYRFDVVSPQEHRHVPRQIGLVHPAKLFLISPRPCPDPFHRVVMHLVDSVPVLVPRPFVVRMAHRRKPSGQLGESVVRRPLSGDSFADGSELEAIRELFPGKQR